MHSFKNPDAGVTLTGTGAILWSLLQGHTSANAAGVKALFAHAGKKKLIDDVSDLAAVNELLAAIQAGDHGAEIFNHPDCHLFLLRLLRDDQLSFEHGVTVYLYIMALQEFTAKQPLPDYHQAYKIPRYFSVSSLIKDGEVSVDGQNYLRKVAKDLEKYTDTSCYEELVEFVKKLPRAEQWLMNIAYGYIIDFSMPWNKQRLNVKDSYFECIVRDILRPGLEAQIIPYFQSSISPINNEQVLLFPAQSIIRFCLAKISADHLKPVFMLGKLDVARTRAYRTANQQPVALYAPHVEDSAMQARGLDCGAFGVAVYQHAQLCWASMLKRPFRDIVYKFIIPNFEKLQTRAKNCGDVITAALIQGLIDKFDEMNMNIVSSYNPEYFMQLFINETFSGFTIHKAKSKLGARQLDGLYFLMQQLKFEEKGWVAEEKSYWTLLLSKVQGYVDSNRGIGLKGKMVSDHLITLANDSVRMLPVAGNTSEMRADWPAWLEIMYSTSDSDALWCEIISSRYNEFLMFVQKAQLNIYHPYLPFTAEKREEFIQFLRSGWLAAQDRAINAPPKMGGWQKIDHN